MLMERNMQIKEKPEFFFEAEKTFDLIIACEERSFSALLDYYCRQDVAFRHKKVYLVNFDISDTIKDALDGSMKIVEFVTSISEHEAEGIDNALRKALERNSEINGKPVLFSVVDY